ncbi:hypothetical protein LOK49_LG02G02303 [Camellia lanceoleosa]|uniref:Uncharacterized protein n=1 Tax=Camellia lanceoleosa TaxID=1840588 RepID=A0ACC0INC1_9ERIC|nr:hypothetical protein LOK49_LG02G02303 [Camellia lanceoleosa]
MTTNVAAAKSRRMFDAREMKRKKRVAKYKWYAVEGKVKASLKKGYRWFKRRCSEIVRIADLAFFLSLISTSKENKLLGSLEIGAYTENDPFLMHLSFCKS